MEYAESVDFKYDKRQGNRTEENRKRKINQCIENPSKNRRIRGVHHGIGPLHLQRDWQCL